jgi:hypothetical protein
MATQFKKIRSVTQTVLKLENGQARNVYVLAPMYQGEKIDTKEPAILLPVADLETGETGVIIAPAVLQTELVKNYDVAGYVTKSFEILKTRDMSVKYNHVAISEISPGDDFTPPAAPVLAPAAVKAASDRISEAIAAKAVPAGAKGAKK